MSGSCLRSALRPVPVLALGLVLASCMTGAVMKIHVESDRATKFILVPDDVWVERHLAANIDNDILFRDYSVHQTPTSINAPSGNSLLVPICAGKRSVQKAVPISVLDTKQTFEVSC